MKQNLIEKLRKSQKKRRKKATRLAMLQDKSTLPLNHHSEQIIKRLLKDGTPDYTANIKPRALEAELTESIVIGANGLSGGTNLIFCQDFRQSGATTYISVRGSGKKATLLCYGKRTGLVFSKEGRIGHPNKQGRGIPFRYKLQDLSLLRMTPFVTTIKLNNEGEFLKSSQDTRTKPGVTDCALASVRTMMLTQEWMANVSTANASPQIKAINDLCAEENKVNKKGMSMIESARIIENIGGKVRQESFICIVRSENKGDSYNIAPIHANITSDEVRQYQTQTAVAVQYPWMEKKHQEWKKRAQRGMVFKNFITNLKNLGMLKKNTIIVIGARRFTNVINPHGTRQSTGHQVNFEWVEKKRISNEQFAKLNEIDQRRYQHYISTQPSHVLKIIDTQNSIPALAMSINSGNYRRLGNMVEVNAVTARGDGGTFKEALNNLWTSCCTSPFSKKVDSTHTDPNPWREPDSLIGRCPPVMDGPLCQNWLEQSFQFEVLCEVKDIAEGSCTDSLSVDGKEGGKEGGRKAKRRKKNKTRKRNKRKRNKRRKTKR